MVCLLWLGIICADAASKTIAAAADDGLIAQ
jgi:hypothetical protein